MVDHQLPAYLQNRTVPDFTDYASDGLGPTLPPHVSIRGNTFTLIDAAGQEFQPIPVMDAVIVDRSSVTCKLYYDKPWTPGQEQSGPPVCWSTNGVGPSRDASTPQARICAECPHNVRGSAISTLSGASIKACRDEYHLAILLPSMPDMMFRYVLTPGSFKNWQAYTGQFKNTNVRISYVVTRMSFVPKVNGEVEFKSVAYVDEATNALVQQALLEKKTDVLVGRLDTSRVAVIAAPVQHGQIQQELGEVKSDLPPLRMGASGTPTAAPSDPAPVQRRRRRTAAEMAEANGTAPAGQAAPAPSVAPRAPFPHPGQTAAGAGTFAANPSAIPQLAVQAAGPVHSGGQAAQGSFGIAQGQPAAVNPELAGMLDDFFKD